MGSYVECGSSFGANRHIVEAEATLRSTNSGNSSQHHITVRRSKHRAVRNIAEQIRQPPHRGSWRQPSRKSPQKQVKGGAPNSPQLSGSADKSKSIADARIIRGSGLRSSKAPATTSPRTHSSPLNSRKEKLAESPKGQSIVGRRVGVLLQSDRIFELRRRR